MTRDAFLRELRRRSKLLGSQRALAESLGVSQQYLCDVLAGRRQGGKIARALGMTVETQYVRKTADAD